MPNHGRSAGKEFGQPIPQDDGEDTLCYQITIPNTSEWRVLIHSLVLHWTSGRYWKRTATGRTIKDIQAKGWEIYETLQPCENGNETEPEIIEIVRNIFKDKCVCMQINCGCCNGNQQVLEGVPNAEAMIPDDTENGLIPTDVPTPTDGGFDDWKCRVSQAIIDLWYGAVLDMRNLIDIGEANTAQVREIVSSVFGLVDGGNLYEFIWNIWQQITYDLVHQMSSEQANLIRTWINNYRIDLTRQLYCSTSASNAKENMIAYLAASRDAGQIGSITWIILRVWLDMLPYEAIYQTAAQRMNAPDYDRIQTSYLANCTCGGGGGLPEVGLPAGYVLVPMIPDPLDPPVPVNGASLSIAGAFYEIQGQGNAFMDITVADPEYDGSIVPLTNVVGFYFRNEMAEIVNGNSTSQRLVNSSTQFTDVNFGAGVNTFLQGEVFAGAIDTEAALQTWLTDNTFRWEDNTAETDTPKRVMSWGIWDGSTGSGLVNEFVVSCYWIINTAGL